MQTLCIATYEQLDWGNKPNRLKKKKKKNRGRDPGLLRESLFIGKGAVSSNFHKRKRFNDAQLPI